MKNILSHFFEEQITLHSPRPAEELIAEIDAVLKKNTWWNSSPNLAGKIDTNGVFKITPRHDFIHINKSAKLTAVMKGRVSENEPGCLVELSIRANWTLLLIAIWFIMIGIILLVFGDKTEKEIWMDSGLCILVIPIAIILLGKLRKHTLIANFKEAFNLVGEDGN